MRRGAASSVLVAMLAILTVACTTSPSGGAAASCHGARWAVGDSITNESPIGIAGWPNQGVAAGHWTNLGQPGGTAAYLADWTLAQLTACVDEKPELIVFEAGLVDIAAGATAAQVEAIYQRVAAGAGVPVRFIVITPFAEFGRLAQFDPVRQQVNAWLRASGAIDCDPVLADANGWLRPELDVDGQVHLTNAGEQALAACVMAATG